MPTSVTLIVNGAPTPLAAPGTVHDLLAAMALLDQRVAVERNGEVVPRSRHRDTRLASGDRVEIIVAVGGG
ncbi:sulfur carrier protein [Crenobacter luteus]|uniref:sulfur carrier protein ThiS n=1 Tax=Crenobacter luteus TaxID=1452487 RepID=UPI00104CAA79|nr:sulfur carrier protein ThiS [Crenobacter luteus]TCP08400.1 sulfur carrier protein [Crenobacter luteus]